MARELLYTRVNIKPEHHGLPDVTITEMSYCKKVVTLTLVEF